ncbi:MAG: hypothetical protein HC902_11720 [Calothrix sp. SM1_5_4]|nr:hypothetical protein [Calothrix sp. SM1_5_4]
MIRNSVNLHHLDESRFTPATSLREGGLELDSVDILEVIVAIEHHFNVKVDDAEMGKKHFRTLGSIAEFVQVQKKMTQHARAVGITGIGAVSCLGADVEAMWTNARSGISGIHDGLGRVADSVLELTPASVRANRALAFCIRSAEEAMAQSGWTSMGPEDGLILATTTGQFLEWDWAFTECVNGRLPRPDFRREFLHQPLGELSRAISAHFAHAGPSTVVTSACSAATQALAVAGMWLRASRVRRVLVIGVEVLCDLTCEGFRSLQLLSLEPARPFDQERKGINLSEGAASLCLEAKADVAAGASAPLAWLAGFGITTDGYHMTSPHPDGEGSYQAMRQAMAKADLRAGDLSWVHAHGTGSVHNDLAEGAAIARLCGDACPWVSSTKWLHGHALGASGALEAVLVIKAMRENIVLPSYGLRKADEAIALRFATREQPGPILHVLKNTLGFGGANAAIVLSAPEAVQ